MKQKEHREPVLKRGLLQVYTGDGKGKTTAALGLALRMSGHGGRVAIIQFMKGWDFYGEIEGLKRLPGLRHERTGTPDYVYRGQERPVDRMEAQRGLDLARECLGGEYDLVVLDELNVVLDFGLLGLQPVLDLLRSRPFHVEVVVTGRGAPQALLEAADLVTEMREIRHPYTKGVVSRRGIDY